MIIFDLDGTIANCEHRRHFVDPKKNVVWDFDMGCFGDRLGWKPDYKAFNEACHLDTPIHSTYTVLRALNMYAIDIEIWSGRCESVREKTLDWFINYFHGDTPHKDSIKSWLNKLIKMRPIGDNTPDDLLKEQWLEETYQETKWGRRTPIQFVFDDRPKVIRMWRRRGIFVFNCNQTDMEF